MDENYIVCCPFVKIEQKGYGLTREVHIGLRFDEEYFFSVVVCGCDECFGIFIS
jgi:hypothetical protein